MTIRDLTLTQDFGPLKSPEQSVEKGPGKEPMRVLHLTENGSQSNTPSPEDKQSTSETPPDDLLFLEPALNPGDLGVLGQYRVLKLIGKGGMGLVFLAEDPQLQRLVALKVMLPHVAKNLSAHRRFLREARVTANIRSDHILTIHEIGQVNNLPYFASEFLKGKPLDAWLEQEPRPVFDQILSFGRQITRGLEAAHKAGVIHRDIKSSNIWVEPSGRIKILDFGLARNVEGDPDLTELGTVLGTPAYMAPEQAEGKPVDARCDLFSLGCVLYELAAGIKPFDGPSTIAVLRAIALAEPAPLSQLNPTLPRAFSDLVVRLMAKDPEKRPRSAAEVAQALEAIAAVKPGAEPATRPVSPLRCISAIVWAAIWYDRRLILEAAVAIVLIIAFLLDMRLLPFFREYSSLASAGTPPRAVNGRLATIARELSDDEILLGMSAPFSGPACELGRAIEVGTRTFFNHVNDGGGIAGRKLKLVVLDDGYQPERALSNMKELYEQRKVFAVIGNVGTHTAEKAMPFARSKKMIFFGAFTGASLLRREPPDRYVFNYRASHGEETAAIVKYLKEIKAMRPEQIAVFAQQDSYGNAGFLGVVKMLRQFGRQPESIVRVGHVRNSIEVGDAVAEILRHKEIRAVVMVSTYRPAAQFIRQLKDAKADLVFANVSDVGADALAEELRQINPEYAAGVIVTQVVPHPASESSLVLKYNELLRKYYPHENPNFASLEGYLNAALFAEGLRRAGNKPTIDSLVDALESIRDLDLGLGTPLRYGPSEHQASHKVWGTILDHSGNFQNLDLE